MNMQRVADDVANGVSGQLFTYAEQAAYEVLIAFLNAFKEYVGQLAFIAGFAALRGLFINIATYHIPHRRHIFRLHEPEMAVRVSGFELVDVIALFAHLLTRKRGKCLSIIYIILP